jgi:uncharacterized spore protein YtfJ
MKNFLVYGVSIVVILSSLMMLSSIVPAASPPSDSAIDDSIQQTLEEVKHVYATELVMGTPLEINDLKIIPLATAGFGFGIQRGPEGADGEQDVAQPGLMRGGGGVLTPVALIVVSGQEVRLVQLSKTFLEQVIGALAPAVIQMLKRPADTETETQSPSTRPGIPAQFEGGKRLAALYMRLIIPLAIGWLLLILILGAFCPKLLRSAVTTLQQNYLRAGLVGLLGYGVAVLLTALFMISLLGIPLAIVVLVAACALTLFGTAGLTLWVGRQLSRAFNRPEDSDMVCLFVGGLVVAVVGITIGFIPFLGWIIWAIFALLAFGTVLQMQWRAVRKNAR